MLAGGPSVTNTATVAASTLDPTPENAAAAATTMIVLPATTTTSTSTTATTPTSTTTLAATTTTSTATLVATTSTSTTSTSTTTPGPRADLSLRLTADRERVAIGALLTYTLAVINRGPDAATDVVLSVALPGAVRFESTPEPEIGAPLATTTPGACTLAGGAVTCLLGELPAGGSVSRMFVVTRIGREAFTTTAVVAGAEADPTPEDNSASASTPAVPSEDCGNCEDDDGDGLVDAEDPDCCTPQPLNVTSARYRAPQSRLRVTGTVAGSQFAGIDPRREDVRLQIRNADGTLTCCTLAPQRWQRLFGKTYGFFDQRMAVCPNVRCVKLALPANGNERATVILGRTTAAVVASPMQFTLSAGDQCTQGSVEFRSSGRGGAVFP